MRCYKNINQLVTLKNIHQKDGRNINSEDTSVINNGAVVFDKDKILWVGETSNIPEKYSSIVYVDLDGYVLTPEIVDSHTHAVFGGNRAFEYSMRLNGADYQDIASAGGGILNTMSETLNTSREKLFKNAVERIERIYSYGVGTIEIKSGYALTYEKEKELSEIIFELKNHFKNKIQIFNTFLAAHAVPMEFKSSQEYLNTVVIPLMEELNAKKIIDAVDIFHEVGYFDEKDTRKLFDKATELNIPIKMHADEFNDNNGAAIACEYNALSCDHLLVTSDSGVEALSKSSTVATLLPGTAFFLGKELANARKFLDAGCKVALASDYNPGSCHCENLVLLASLAAKRLDMNIAEVWSAICYNSAHALGLRDQGAIDIGLRPRFSLFKCDSFDEIIYSWGKNLSISV